MRATAQHTVEEEPAAVRGLVRYEIKISEWGEYQRGIKPEEETTVGRPQQASEGKRRVSFLAVKAGKHSCLAACNASPGIPQANRGPSVAKGQTGLHGVEQAYAAEVLEWTEMCHALLAGRIEDVDGKLTYFLAAPCGVDEIAQFAFIARCAGQTAGQSGERIGTVPGLCVAQPEEGVEGEPEVAETVGKCAPGVDFLTSEVAGAHNVSLWMSYGLADEERQLVGAMLTVGIDGYGSAEALFAGIGEGAAERGTLASVAFLPQHGDAVAETVEHIGRGVVAAVVNGYHIAAIFERPFDYCTHGVAIVVNRHDNTYHVVAGQFRDFLLVFADNVVSGGH